MSICPYCHFRVGRKNRIKVDGVWEHRLCPKEGVEHKKKITNELIIRANAIFNKKSMILTGDGLSRRELKLLERRGRVKKSYRSYGSGTLRCVWMRPSTHEELKEVERLKKKKAREEEKALKQVMEHRLETKKLSIFRRFWRFIKKKFGGKNGTTNIVSNKIHKS